jgi:nicotinate-nucleotide adenylyltransferase
MTGPVTAIFGGTFDPVHFGHLRAALETREFLGLSSITLLPAGAPPHRANPVTPAVHRVAMLRLALQGMPGFTIDEREIERDGPSYMVDTLAGLRLDSADATLLLVIGQDSANSFDTWHRWRDILDLASLAFMSRPGDRERYSDTLREELAGRFVDTPEDIPRHRAGRVIRVPVTGLDISSSAIREMLRSGGTPRFLLPDAVLAYAREKALYTAP